MFLLDGVYASYSHQLLMHVLSETFSLFPLFKNISRQRACEANAAGENSSFTFTVCVKSVPLYHFKLAYVVLHVTIKEFFEAHF